MKKKILGMVLTATLLVTSSVSAVYADKNGNGKSSGSPVEKSDVVKDKEKVDKEKTVVSETAKESTVTPVAEIKTEASDSEKDVDSLKEQLKKVHKDKQARKDIIKELVESRKQQNDDTIPVFINGEEMKSDVPPVIKYNRILIPVRAVTNSLGAEVMWNESTATATITKTVYGSTYQASTITIELKLDSKIAIVNGEEVELDTEAETMSNRMLVPLRFIAETFKNYVEWDEDNNCAIIEDKDGEGDNEAASNATEENTSSSSGHKQIPKKDKQPGTST